MEKTATALVIVAIWLVVIWLIVRLDKSEKHEAGPVEDGLMEDDSWSDSVVYTYTDNFIDSEDLMDSELVHPYLQGDENLGMLDDTGATSVIKINRSKHHEAERRERTLDEEYAAAHGMWVCDWCETLNGNSEKTCVACGAHRN